MYGESRFASLKPSPGEREPSPRWGFIRCDNAGEREYWILTAGWEQICEGLDKNLAAKALADAGHLVRGKDGKTSQSLHIPAFVKTARVYIVRSSIFEAKNE